MPVRIYDIAKKLDLENKVVLAKAKELGISAAKVPSSSLDKITAEFLEEKLMAGRPKPTPALAPAAPTAEIIPLMPLEDTAFVIGPPSEPVSIVVPGPPPPAPAAPTAPTPGQIVPLATPLQPTATPPSEVTPPPASPPPDIAVARIPTPIAPAQPERPPAPPPPPPGPKLGEKVGFIQLTPKPAPRPPDRPAGNRQPPRPGMPQRQDQRGGRMDNRGQRGGGQFGQRGGGQFGGQRQGQFGRDRGAQQTPAVPAEPKFVPPTTGEVITLKPPVIVRDLAEKLNRKPFQLIADLIELKVLANVNQAIDETVAQRLCAKYGFRFETEKRERGAALVSVQTRKVETLDPEDKPEELRLRAPVVTIMGHVDHGKTTLLDTIRKANVAAGEAGGITQHIGAYTISFPHPSNKQELRQITFLDTPGHAAFSAMRARGANVTDLVILVVAANDGVMPQTLEAMSHAQAARVPLIVAVNKIDHPNANAMKVRQQLQDKGVVPDDWGGNTTFVEVSGLTRQGVDHLLELILLQADIMELKANPNRRAKGNVIESGLAPGGPTATVLVRKGTLRVGDILLCGPFYGKVRALINEEGQRLKEAGPSVAVKVLGLNGVPEAGLEFTVVEDEKSARAISEERFLEARSQSQEARAKVTLETIFQTLDEAKAKVLKVVVKADTQGSVEAIVEALKKIESEHVSLEVIHNAVGSVTENDVILASASKGLILGFHTRIDPSASELAKREGVQIKLYSIIYELIDEVKEAMAGMLDPVLKETVIGAAEVKKIFELSKGGTVAGCVIASGRIARGKVRVMRRRNLIYEGQTSSIRRFQDEVNEVRAGMECGIRIEGFNEFQVGDSIESYTIERVAQKL